MTVLVCKRCEPETYCQVSTLCGDSDVPKWCCIDGEECDWEEFHPVDGRFC